MEKKADEGVIKLVEKAMQAVKDTIPGIDQDIDFIISNNIRAEKEIEMVLDQILDCLYVGCGEEEFKRLNTYYSGISKENAGEYDKFYDEMHG